MEEAGGPAERIVSVGGGTQGGLWTQVVSDVTGREQLLPGQTIGASYGDALLAAIGNGLVTPDTDWTSVAGTVSPTGPLARSTAICTRPTPRCIPPPWSRCITWPGCRSAARSEPPHPAGSVAGGDRANIGRAVLTGCCGCYGTHLVGPPSGDERVALSRRHSSGRSIRRCSRIRCRRLW
jgi:hypothetical protein